MDFEVALLFAAIRTVLTGEWSLIAMNKQVPLQLTTKVECFLAVWTHVHGHTSTCIWGGGGDCLTASAARENTLLQVFVVV